MSEESKCKHGCEIDRYTCGWCEEEKKWGPFFVIVRDLAAMPVAVMYNDGLSHCAFCGCGLSAGTHLPVCLYRRAVEATRVTVKP